jgi:hypothetical protein
VSKDTQDGENTLMMGEKLALIKPRSDSELARLKPKQVVQFEPLYPTEFEKMEISRSSH